SARYESEKVKLNRLQASVNAALKDVKSIRDERIDSLYVDKGFLESEIMQLRGTLEKAELYQTLSKKRVALEEEIKRLNIVINSIEADQYSKRKSINDSIEKKGLYLLNNDLERQDDFIAAK